MERIEARLPGEAFATHRHDTYALGLTLHGVQIFRYRGSERHSTRGKIIVLHPDEPHDGGAGTGEGLRYRMLYLEPARLRQALDDDGAPLPFVERPVIEDGTLRSVLLAALDRLDEDMDGLLANDVAVEVAQALVRHGDGARPGRSRAFSSRATRLARDYLIENAARVVRSKELERVCGLDRFALSRYFRAAFGTSPHRFVMMRRLQLARRLIAAAATGFADQSHLHRHFKKAFGLTPGRWAALIAADRWSSTVKPQAQSLKA